MARVDKARPILNLIYKYESVGAMLWQKAATPYDVVWSGIRPEDRTQSPITKLKVSRVLWWQDTIDPLYQSEAAGAPQIMEDTLRGLVKEGHASLDELYDADCQDRLALALMDRRGWSRCEAGRLTPEAFGNELAKEWASLPVISGPKKGCSYYAGDGLNASHATTNEVLAAIEDALDGDDTVETERPTPEDTVIAWLRRAPEGYREVGAWLAEGTF